MTEKTTQFTAWRPQLYSSTSSIVLEKVFLDAVFCCFNCKDVFIQLFILEDVDGDVAKLRSVCSRKFLLFFSPHSNQWQTAKQNTYLFVLSSTV